jgi:rhamnulokinase
MASKNVTYCAAVDLGATNGRVVVGTWRDNKLRLTDVHRFSNEFRSLNGHDYIDLPGIWAQIVIGLRKAKRKFPQLASVGVDTWGVDYALLNKAGRIVFPSHAYRDSRTTGGLKRLESKRTSLVRVYAATGIPNIFYNSSLQLQETIETCPGIRHMVARCLFLPDYFNYLLSGRMENEISFASTTQLLSVSSTDWSRTALDHFRVPHSWLSKPILANTKLGRIRGLPELRNITVVAVPGHDTACAYSAMPARSGGRDLYISSGTWSLVGFESTKPILGSGALAARISNERCGDGSYRPLTGLIGLWLLEQTLKEFAARPRSKQEWTHLIEKASSLPASSHPLEIDDSALKNPPSMRSAIDAQLRRRGLPRPRSAAGYTRLICDSLGKAHADALNVFEHLMGKKFDRILIVGGGSKNRLLCQATADASHLPVWSYDLEGSAVGNVASQLVALGAVGSLARFRELFSAQITPTIYGPSLS